MPTVLRVRGYRFHFWSNENTVKVWLDTLAITQSVGYDSREIRAVVELVREHQDDLLKAWNEYFT